MNIKKNKFIIYIILLIFISFLFMLHVISYNSTLKLNAKINKLTMERDSLLLSNNKNKKEDINLKQNISDSFTYLNPNVDPLIKEQIINSIISECKKVNLPPLLILCIIKQESNFNPLVINKFNASGLMQIIPKYHQDKIKAHGWNKHQIFFIKNNILLGTEILKEYFVKENNDMVKTLQKYVGAKTKNNAKKYIENIINDYVSLEVIFFMNNKIIKKD